jgi:hypothetical protein
VLLRFLIGELDVVFRIALHFGDEAAEDLFIDGEAHRKAVANFAIGLGDDEHGVGGHGAVEAGFDDEAGVALDLGIAGSEDGFELGGLGRSFVFLTRDF